LDNKRRELFRILAIAGVTTTAVPESWKKPIIKKVVLPAHAIMTGECTATTTNCSPSEVTSSTVSDDTDNIKIDYDAGSTCGLTVIANNGSNTADTALRIDNDASDWQLNVGEGSNWMTGGTDLGPLVNLTQAMKTPPERSLPSKDQQQF